MFQNNVGIQGNMGGFNQPNAQTSLFGGNQMHSNGSMNTAAFGNNQGMQQNNSILMGNQMMGNQRFTLTTEMPAQELSNVLDNFQKANHPDYPDCLFTFPVYDFIPQNFNNQGIFNQPGYNQMNPNIWAEYQNNNPDKSKFFVNEVRSYQSLAERYQRNLDNSKTLIKNIEESLKRIRDYSAKNKDHKVELIKNLNKNMIIMDKILVVHKLIENAASKYNFVTKNPEKEMILFKELNEIENMKNLISNKASGLSTKLFDKEKEKKKELELEGQRQNGQFFLQKKSNFLSNEDLSGSKEKFFEALKEFKKSIHTLQNISERNSREMNLMNQYLQKLY